MNAIYTELLARTLPELALVITAFAALGLDLMLRKRKRGAERMREIGRITLVGLLACAGLMLMTSGMEPVFKEVGDARTLGGKFYEFTLGMFASNPLTNVMKLVVVSLTVIVTLVAMERGFTHHIGEFFAVTLFAAVGMMLLLSAEELIVIFVALELTSISLYILTAFHKGSLRSAEAALKYFMFGAVSSAFLLFGLAWIYGATGHTSLVGIREAIVSGGLQNNMILLVGVVFSVVGFGFKVAVVPFHLWAPDAYEGAPTPVTAFIATASKVASFVVAAKVLLIAFPTMAGLAYWRDAAIGWTPVLAVLAVLSMVVGNCAAIVQKNVKRLLAYSSIAHAGYIFVGLIGAGALNADGTPNVDAQRFGMTSVLFYVVVYGLTTLGAFGVVHAMEEKAGGCNLENFNGMSKRAPFLSLLLMVFILSLTGVPPLGGFFGKFYLFAAAVNADPSNLGLLWLVWFGVMTSAVSLYYYMLLLKHVYVAPSRDESRVESSVPIRVAMGLTCLAVVVLGVYPTRLLEELGNSLVYLPMR